MIMASPFPTRRWMFMCRMQRRRHPRWQGRRPHRDSVWLERAIIPYCALEETQPKMRRNRNGMFIDLGTQMAVGQILRLGYIGKNLQRQAPSHCVPTGHAPDIRPGDFGM